MYTIKNGTTSDFWFESEKISPHQEIEIQHPIFSEEIFRNEELGMCVHIITEQQIHKAKTFGNVICNPESGKDGTIFEIRTKN